MTSNGSTAPHPRAFRKIPIWTSHSSRASPRLNRRLTQQTVAPPATGGSSPQNLGCSSVSEPRGGGGGSGFSGGRGGPNTSSGTGGAYRTSYADVVWKTG